MRKFIMLRQVAHWAQQPNIANPVATTPRQGYPVIAVELLAKFTAAMEAFTLLLFVKSLYFCFGKCTFSSGFTGTAAAQCPFCGKGNGDHVWQADPLLWRADLDAAYRTVNMGWQLLKDYLRESA